MDWSKRVGCGMRKWAWCDPVTFMNEFAPCGATDFIFNWSKWGKKVNICVYPRKTVTAEDLARKYRLPAGMWKTLCGSNKYFPSFKRKWRHSTVIAWTSDKEHDVTIINTFSANIHHVERSGKPCEFFHTDWDAAAWSINRWIAAVHSAQEIS